MNLTKLPKVANTYGELREIGNRGGCVAVAGKLMQYNLITDRCGPFLRYAGCSIKDSKQRAKGRTGTIGVISAVDGLAEFIPEVLPV